MFDIEINYVNFLLLIDFPFRCYWDFLFAHLGFVFFSLILFLAIFTKHIPVYSWEGQSIPEIGRGIQYGTEILLQVTHIWIT